MASEDCKKLARSYITLTDEAARPSYSPADKQVLLDLAAGLLTEIRKDCGDSYADMLLGF